MFITSDDEIIHGFEYINVWEMYGSELFYRIFPHFFVEIPVERAREISKSHHVGREIPTKIPYQNPHPPPQWFQIMGDTTSPKISFQNLRGKKHGVQTIITIYPPLN